MTNFSRRVVYHLKKTRTGTKTMNLKVAIAEDNRQNLRLIKMLCESEFFSVLTASDGNEMNRTIDEYLPEIIITDLIMPRSHGLNVIKHARRKKNYSPVIIVVSELRSKEYINLCFDHGADYFVPKPLSKEAVRKLLRTIRQNSHIFR